MAKPLEENQMMPIKQTSIGHIRVIYPLSELLWCSSELVDCIVTEFQMIVLLADWGQDKPDICRKSTKKSLNYKETS